MNIDIVANELKAWVDEKIENNDVVVFSKSYCPYCRAAKQFLKEKYPQVQAVVFELDQSEEGVPDGAQIQNYLEQKTGQRTVPNIFVKTEHIGGNSDLQGSKKQKVDNLLGAA